MAAVVVVAQVTLFVLLFLQYHARRSAGRTTCSVSSGTQNYSVSCSHCDCDVLQNESADRPTRQTDSSSDSGTQQQQLDQLRYENDKLKIALAQR